VDTLCTGYRGRLAGIILNAMERKPGTFEMKRSRLLSWSQAQARNTEELLETTRRLNHAVGALEIEVNKTGEDIRKAHKTYEHSSRKKPGSA
jgi:hypothetical protein